MFSIVTIEDCEPAQELKLVGSEGIVLGLTQDDVTGETWCALKVGDLAVVMLPAMHLTPTGRSVVRHEIYQGDSIRVSRDGIVLSVDVADDVEGLG